MKYYRNKNSDYYYGIDKQILRVDLNGYSTGIHLIPFFKLFGQLEECSQAEFETAFILATWIIVDQINPLQDESIISFDDSQLHANACSLSGGFNSLHC